MTHTHNYMLFVSVSKAAMTKAIYRAIRCLDGFTYTEPVGEGEEAHEAGCWEQTGAMEEKHHWCLHENCAESLEPFASARELEQHMASHANTVCSIEGIVHLRVESNATLAQDVDTDDTDDDMYCTVPPFIQHCDLDQLLLCVGLHDSLALLLPSCKCAFYAISKELCDSGELWCDEWGIRSMGHRFLLDFAGRHPLTRDAVDGVHDQRGCDLIDHEHHQVLSEAMKRGGDCGYTARRSMFGLHPAWRRVSYDWQQFKTCAIDGHAVMMGATDEACGFFIELHYTYSKDQAGQRGGSRFFDDIRETFSVEHPLLCFDEYVYAEGMAVRRRAVGGVCIDADMMHHADQLDKDVESAITSQWDAYIKSGRRRTDGFGNIGKLFAPSWFELTYCVGTSL